MTTNSTQPPVQARDPQSLYLAQLMRSLGQQPIRTGGALASDLLAEALLQWKQKQSTQGASDSSPATPLPPTSGGVPQPDGAGGQ